MIEDEQISAHLQGLDDDVGEFSFSEEIFGVELRPVLENRVKNLHVTGPGQFLEFLQGAPAVEEGIRFNAQKNGPVGGIHLAGTLGSGKLVFQGGDEGQKVRLQIGYSLRRRNQPVTTILVFGNEVGGGDKAGQPVRAGFHRADKIQAKKGQIAETSALRGSGFRCV